MPREKNERIWDHVGGEDGYVQDSSTWDRYGESATS